MASATTFTQTRAERSRPPSLGPAPQLKIPPIEKRTLSNGLPVWIVEAPEVPLAQVNLVIHAGSSDDAANASGLASFTAAMLDEGAGTRSSLQIADEVAEIILGREDIELHDGLEQNFATFIQGFVEGIVGGNAEGAVVGLLAGFA